VKALSASWPITKGTPPIERVFVVRSPVEIEENTPLVILTELATICWALILETPLNDDKYPNVPKATKELYKDLVLTYPTVPSPCIVDVIDEPV